MFLIGAGAVVWALLRVVAALREIPVEARRHRIAALLTMFAPGMAAAPSDARALLAWHRVATTARKILPDDFQALDRAIGSPFPFNREAIEQALAKWTSEWLEWEQSHTTTYRLKIAEAQAELASDPSAPRGRARLDAMEREKLELYQARYSQYVQVAKALQAIVTAP
jgi:hypothetical protein